MTDAIWLPGRRKRDRAARTERYVPTRQVTSSRRRSDKADEPARSLRRETQRPPEIEPERPAFLFRTHIDLTELDDRNRPTANWNGRAEELGPAHLIFRSRRMCHLGRRILIAVHLMDATPVALYGEVTQCEYDREGMHVTELSLRPLPADDETIAQWVNSRSAHGTL